MPRLGGRLPKLANRHDDAQPLVRALIVALAADLEEDDAVRYG